MKPTERLHNLGQSLWLDNITRPMLREGVLEGYIRDLSVTGLTSNPSIFEKAISSGEAYDEQIAELAPSAAAGAPRPPFSPPPPAAPPASTASSRSRSRRCSPTTRRRRSSRRRRCT